MDTNPGGHSYVFWVFVNSLYPVNLKGTWTTFFFFSFFGEEYVDYIFYTLLFYAFNLSFSNIFYNDTWSVLPKNDTCLILWWQIITSTFLGADKTKLFLPCDIPMPLTFPCHYLFVCFLFFVFCSDVSYARHGFDCNIYSLLLVGKVNGCTILI